MKIRVEDLRPNPFRRIDRYPISREKVEALKTSIQETTFWDNLLARRNADGKIEIAYGHHRLQALNELGIEEVDIPVRDLNDTMMIKTMANENLDTWRHHTAVILETVAATKEFLDAELSKFETLEEMRQSNSHLTKILGVKREQEFQALRAKGAGQETICKFLGGNWKLWVVQHALAILADNGLDREAVEKLTNLRHATAFRNELAQQIAAVPELLQRQSQVDLAGEIIRRISEKKQEPTAVEIRRQLKAIAKEVKGETAEVQGGVEADPKTAMVVEQVNNLSERAELLAAGIKDFSATTAMVQAEGVENIVELLDGVNSQSLLELAKECRAYITGVQAACITEGPPTLAGDGAINRQAFLRILDFLKSGLGKVIESLDCYHFIDGYLITYSDAACVAIPFAAPFEGYLSQDLHGLLSSMSGETISMESDGGSVIFRSGHSAAPMALFETSPDIRTYLANMIEQFRSPDPDYERLPDNFLNDLVTCAPLASTNCAKPPLTGVYVQDGDMVVSDNYTAGWMRLKGRVEQPFLLGAPLISALKPHCKPVSRDFRLDNYRVIGEWVHFKGKAINIALRLIEAGTLTEDGELPEGAGTAYPYHQARSLFETGPESPVPYIFPPDFPKVLKGLRKFIKKQESDPTCEKAFLIFGDKSLTCFAKGERGERYSHTMQWGVSVPEDFAIAVEVPVLLHALERMRCDALQSCLVGRDSILLTSGRFSQLLLNLKIREDEIDYEFAAITPR